MWRSSCLMINFYPNECQRWLGDAARHCQASPRVQVDGSAPVRCLDCYLSKGELSLSLCKMSLSKNTFQLFYELHLTSDSLPLSAGQHGAKSWYGKLSTGSTLREASKISTKGFPSSSLTPWSTWTTLCQTSSSGDSLSQPFILCL